MTAVRVAIIIATWPLARAYDWAGANWAPLGIKTAIVRARRPWAATDA